jgi:hypothetical protein
MPGFDRRSGPLPLQNLLRSGTKNKDLPGRSLEKAGPHPMMVNAIVIKAEEKHAA